MNLGQTSFHSNKNRFGLLDKDASLHGFVVGSSGSGKTTLLTTAITSLIKRGQGITLVDFHGDFARSIENAIPKSERNRLVSFSPLSSKPIAFNPLFCPDPERWPVVTDSVLSGMRNLFGHSWGPRLEQILQMALSAAIAAQSTTLADVRKMLSDEPTRVKILSRVTDPIVRQFWFETFVSWGKRLQVEATQSKRRRSLGGPINGVIDNADGFGLGTDQRTRFAVNAFVVEAIPEPSSAAFLALLGIGTLCRRRRR